MTVRSSYRERQEEAKRKADDLHAFILKNKTWARVQSDKDSESGIWKAYYTGMGVGLEKVEHYLKGGK